MKKIALSILPVLVLAASCSRMDDIVDSANTKIRTYLHGQKIYDPNNYPDPVPTDIKGNYQIIDGAFRYIVSQDSDGRENWEEVRRGDVISIRFDARIFSGSSFDRFPLFYSNNATTIEIYRGSNDQFDPVEWPTTPYIAKIGGGQLMPAVENALVSCRAGDKVQLFLPPDIAYAGKQNYTVPANSTLAFEITIEGIQTDNDHVTEYFNSLGIYDRAFAPADADGYYDRIGYGYRYILNEGRTDRPATGAAAGNSIYYWFDARVFGSSVADSPYFYSNIESVIDIIAAENPGSDTAGWAATPQGVVVGDNNILVNGKDSGKDILKALGNTLPTCREGDKVWVFLLPEAYEDETPEGIAPPAGSTLMYELEITELTQ